MSWFVLFACTVFGLYFWREHNVQQQDLQSASAPHRTGERYIGQVLTLAGRPARRHRSGEARQSPLDAARPERARRRAGPVTGVDGTVLIVDRLPG